MSCGIQNSIYIPYPRDEVRSGNKSPDTACPVALAAFEFFVSPLLKERCTVGCHSLWGNAASIMVFGRGVTADRSTLISFRDGSDEELFLKASGQKPHGGGDAARPSDRDLFKRWAVAERLCVQKNDR